MRQVKLIWSSLLLLALVSLSFAHKSEDYETSMRNNHKKSLRDDDRKHYHEDRKSNERHKQYQIEEYDEHPGGYSQEERDSYVKDKNWNGKHKHKYRDETDLSDYDIEEDYHRKNKWDKEKHHKKSDKYEQDKKYYKKKNKERHDHSLIDLRDDQVVPPNHTKYIAMARFVVHVADWSTIATISTLSTIKGFPFSNVVSMSDGPVDNSTGVPYFYLTPLDFTSKDLSKDSRCTVTVTLEETDYCRDNQMEADDPRCARVMLSGKIKRVRNDTSEYDFAKKALFSRHPSMAKLPEDHHFYIAKLKIAQIAMLDWFGGPKYIAVQDYLAFSGNINGDAGKVSHIDHNDLLPSVSQE